MSRHIVMASQLSCLATRFQIHPNATNFTVLNCHESAEETTVDYNMYRPVLHHCSYLSLLAIVLSSVGTVSTMIAPGNTTQSEQIDACLQGGSEEAELFFNVSVKSSNVLCEDPNTTGLSAHRLFDAISEESINSPRTSSICGTPSTSLTHCPTDVELEIVIAQFSSSITTLSKHINRLLSGDFMSKKLIGISVYTKNQDLDLQRYQMGLRSLLWYKSPRIVVNVYRNPNVGRETLTFTHHILAQWSSLADHTLFTQEDMYFVGGVRHRIEQHLRPNTAFLSLSPFHELCTDLNCSDARANGAHWPGVRYIWSSELDSGQLEPLLMVYKSQFVISRSRIRRRPFSDYVGYHQALSAPAPSDLHTNPKAQEYYRERNFEPKDYGTDPYYGHTFERSWALIAGCNELKIYHSCNSFWTALWLRLTLRSQSNMVCGCEE